MANEEAACSDPRIDKPPPEPDIPASVPDREWSESLGIRTSTPEPESSPVEMTEDAGKKTALSHSPSKGASTVESQSTPMVEFLLSNPSNLEAPSNDTSTEAQNAETSPLVAKTLLLHEPLNQPTAEDLYNDQILETEIDICNQYLQGPSSLLVEPTSIENNIKFLFSQFASGAFPCETKSLVKFLARDLTKKGIMDRSNEFLYRDWPDLQGSAPMDVLLLLYSRLVAKASADAANQVDILQHQLKEMKEISFSLDVEKTKNQALGDQKAALEQELKQKELEQVADQSVEDKYISQLQDLKKTLLQLRESNQQLSHKLQTQNESISNLRVKQASMISLEESSAELDAIKETLNAMETEKRQMAVEQEKLSTDLAGKNAKLQVLTKETAAAQSTNKDLRLQLDAAKKENVKQQVAITDLNVTNKTNTDDIQSLNKDNEKLLEDLSLKDSKIASLKKKLADKDKLLSKDKPAQQRVALAHKTEVETLLSKIKTLDSEKKKTNAIIAAKDADLVKIQKNLQKVETQLKDAKKDNDNSLASMALENPSLNHLEEKLSVAEYNNEELQKAKEELAEENDNKEAKIRSLQDKVSSLELRIDGSATEATVVAMQTEIAKLEKELADATMKINDLGSTNESLEVEIEEANEKALDLEDRLITKERRISDILKKQRRDRFKDSSDAMAPLPRQLIPTPDPTVSRPDETKGGEREKDTVTISRDTTPTPSSDASTATGAPSPFPTRSHSPTPERTVVENLEDFQFGPADPSSEFPNDILDQDQPSPSLKRHQKSPHMTSKLTRYSQSPEASNHQPVPTEKEAPIRPPLLRSDLFEHYDTVTPAQHANVLGILRSSKGKVIAKLQEDRQFIAHLRSTASEDSKQKAVNAVVKSLSRCVTVRELNGWNPDHQSEQDFQPFPDLSEGSPEWEFIAHRHERARFVHHGAIMALFRAYCSKAYRFFEFAKWSNSPNVAQNTCIHLHPRMKDKTGEFRSIWEMKLDLLLVLIIVRLALFETDNVPLFPTNRQRIEHYVNVPFSLAWYTEMVETRSSRDPYLLPKEHFVHFYIDRYNCANALDAWEGRTAPSPNGGARPSIMDLL